MNKIFLLLAIFIFSFGNAQQYIIGKVTTERETEVPGVIVFNPRTDEQTITNTDGHFMISAVSGDELRFIRKNFDRTSVKLKDEDFTKPLNVSIYLMTEEIEEVQLGFKPSGILKKDVAALNQPRKVVELNRNIASSMRIPPTTSYPSVKMPSTLQQGPNFSVGQGNVIGLIGAIAGAVSKKVSPKTTANFAETQAFYKRIKLTVDLNYFYKHGLDEYQFDQLMAYADQRFDLSKNYRNNFNRTQIESYLRMALKDFLDVKGIVSSAESPS